MGEQSHISMDFDSVSRTKPFTWHVILDFLA